MCTWVPGPLPLDHLGLRDQTHLTIACSDEPSKMLQPDSTIVPPGSSVTPFPESLPSAAFAGIEQRTPQKQMLTNS